MALTEIQLRNLISFNVPDNTQGLVTPFKVREVMNEIVTKAFDSQLQSLTADNPLSFNAATKTLSLPRATAGQSGYLHAFDFAVFNAVAGDYVSQQGEYHNPSWLVELSWEKITDKPTIGTVAAIDTNGNGAQYLAGDGAWKTISLSGYVTVSGTETISGAKTFSSLINATAGIGTSGATNFDLYANNTLAMRIFQSTGNFNIGNGTVDTGYRLNVQGQGNFTSGVRIAGTGTVPFTITQDIVSGVNSLLSIANSIAAIRLELTASGAGFTTTANSTGFGSGSGVLNIGNTTTGGTFRIVHQSGETYFDSQQNNRLRFRTNTGGATLELMRMENTGNILIGTTTDAASAILNVRSTTKGVVFSPMTTAQRTAIASPATGLMLYDTDLSTYCFYNGTSWQKINHSPA